jgi:replicative DNA helicase
MNDGKAFWAMREKIDDDLFFLPRHRLMWVAIDGLRSRSAAVDPITIKREIDAKNSDQPVSAVQIKDVFNFLPSSKHWEVHLRYCDDQKCKRRMWKAGRKMMEQAKDEGRTPQQIRAQVERVLEQIVEKRETIVTASDAVVSRLNDWNQAAETKGQSSLGILTGIPRWDKATRGLRPKTIHVIVGDAKAGKTSLALQMGTFSAVNCNVSTLVFSLEMSIESLIDKLVCCESGISIDKVLNGTIGPDDSSRIFTAANRIAESPIYFWPGAHLNPTKFEAIAHRAKEEYAVEMLVVDYYQLMDGDDTKKNREQQLNEIGRSMKKVALELCLPILVIAQLNDDGKLRESRSLKMHADTMTRISVKKRLHYLDLEYNRDGPTDKVPCLFHKNQGRFEETTAEEEEEDDEKNS